MIIKNYIPLFTTILIFLTISLREFVGNKIKIYIFMTIGALIVLLTGCISPKEAFKSIDFDVIIFLTSIFIVGESLFESGFIYSLSYRLFSKTKNLEQLLFFFIIIMGIFSYFFMNDTMATIGTFLAIHITKKFSLPSVLFLLSLAYSITIGSVASPIGNPQNLIIASKIQDISLFYYFTKYLLIPTIINLFITFYFIKFFYRKKLDFSKPILFEKENYVKNKNFILSVYATLILIVMIIVKILLPIFIKDFKFPLFFIPLPSALLILIFSNSRKQILKNLDYRTLIFFISMFILMKSVYLKEKPEFLFNFQNLKMSKTLIFVSSLLLSQLISNVPFVILFLETFKNISLDMMMVLAASSTIAGNIFLLGAASNIIILQTAEKRSRKLTVWEFSKIGIPLSLINSIIYIIFFKLF